MSLNLVLINNSLGEGLLDDLKYDKNSIHQLQVRLRLKPKLLYIPNLRTTMNLGSPDGVSSKTYINVTAESPVFRDTENRKNIMDLEGGKTEFTEFLGQKLKYRNTVKEKSIKTKQKPIKQNCACTANLDQTCFSCHVLTVYTCFAIMCCNCHRRSQNLKFTTPKNTDLAF